MPRPSPLTREQLEALREQVGGHLRYLSKLCERLRAVGVPEDDRLVTAAWAARNAVMDLHTAVHYAGCDTVPPAFSPRSSPPSSPPPSPPSPPPPSTTDGTGG